MSQLVNRLNPLKIGVLFAVLVLGVGIAYGTYTVAFDRPGDTGISEDEQLIPVTRGDLVNDVSVSGSLAFPIRETLEFGTAGKVSQLLVEEGQSVSKGQSLAVLDEETIAALNKAAAQAQVSVRDAEEALDGARNPVTDLELALAEANLADARITHRASLDTLAEESSPATTLELAQAEANLADARVTHKAALDALNEILQPSTQQLTDAEAKVSNSKVSLAEAEESLGSIMEADSEAIARAESAVVTAKIAVDHAQEALADILSAPEEDDVAKAQLKVDSASTTLANAHRDRKISVSEWDDKIEAVEASLDTAVQTYKEAFLTWLGISLDGDQQRQDPDTLLDSFGADLEILFDSDFRFYDLGQWTNTNHLGLDKQDTGWNERTIYIWMNLYPGTIYPTCLDGNLPDKGRCVRQELDDAWDLVQQAMDATETTNISAGKVAANAKIAISNSENSLSAALEELNELTEAPEPLHIESLEKDITVAQASLDTAVGKLASLMDGPDEVTVDAGKSKVALAKANLNTATEELASLMNGPDEVDAEAKKAKVSLASADLNDAEQNLEELLSDPDPLDLNALTKDLSVAVENLKVAEETVSELKEGPDPLITSLRETDLAAARASLDSALKELETATITAPWTGIISAVNIEVGRNVNISTPAIEIVDPTVVEVNGAVDEIDVLYLREGASALITMDALPGQTLTGSVSEISTQSMNQQGVVTYPISIRIETNGLQLPEGLTAVASVVLREDKNVLLVPLDALHGSFDNPLVRVSSNGQIEERPVELGNTDDFWIVVTSGVAEAELVVMKSQQAETSFGFGGFGRGFGRGFGGGSGPPSRTGGGQ
ncbi:MAG: HlyD family efflux transporter periplasmic adaptor subunit [SAR202 cluster bacterium]|nr:HlyD family efflux transporter periplasmic adaptor subunit [SAR202 cluster bacterium]